MDKRRIIATMLGLVMAFIPYQMAWAFDNGEFHYFRDEEISIYLPEGWVSDEAAYDDFGEADGKSYEKIMEAVDAEGSSGLKLSVYYASEDARGDYIYFYDDEDGAEWYYEEYGEAAVDGVYDVELAWPLEDGDMSSQWSLSEPEFFGGEVNGFLVVTGSGNTRTADEKVTFEHTIYITTRMTDDSESVVHMFLVFYNDDYTELTRRQAKLAQEIADEFYDYDYYNVMSGISSGWDTNEGVTMYSEDGFERMLSVLFGVFIPLIAIVAIAIAISKKKGRKKKTSNAAGSALRSFSTRRREERRSLQPAERRSTMQMRRHEAESAEQRYYASLQTLLNSGLLTKEEMRDMLERHERSKARQRKKGEGI